MEREGAADGVGGGGSAIIIAGAISYGDVADITAAIDDDVAKVNVVAVLLVLMKS